MMSLSLSVIICTKDRPSDLNECIASILKGNRLPEEIVIIDDGHLDISQLQETLRKNNIDFQYRRKSPPNVSASRNLATSIARGNILSFLDDDVILDANYYSSVMQTFEKDYKQEIAGITGAIKLETHPLKRAYLRFFGLEGNQPGKVQSCGAVTLVRAGELSQPIRIEWLSGCNMNFRRWIFSEFRFDERDSGYIWGDDRDFTFPIGQRYLLIALPDAILVHKKSPISRSSVKNLGRMEVFHLGRFFVEKLPIQKKNWTSLGWAFIGIIMKNALCILNPPRSVMATKQLIGNFEGIFQFLAYLIWRNEDVSQR